MQGLIEKLEHLKQTSDGSQIPEVHMAVETYNQAIDDAIRVVQEEFSV